jgi:phage terminase small subunit
VPLNAKRAAFVREYLKDLNATQAAIRAGYSAKTAYSIGGRLLKEVEVAQAISKKQTHLDGKAIATRVERQQFWTRVLLGMEEDAKMADRLKASELLGKSEADFTDKLEHSGTMSIAVVNPYSKRGDAA